MTRHPFLCEPDKDVASFHRHLISLPITFTKIALRGCLGGEIIIDLSQPSVLLKQTSRRKGNIQNIATHSQNGVGGTVPWVSGDYGCILWMANNAITQMLYVVQMKMIPVTFVLGVRNPPRSSHFCLSHHRKKKKKIDLHLILPMSSTFKKDSLWKNGIAIATRNFFQTAIKLVNFQDTKACSEPRSTWIENKTDGKFCTAFAESFFCQLFSTSPYVLNVCFTMNLWSVTDSRLCSVELEVSTTIACSHERLICKGQESC